MNTIRSLTFLFLSLVILPGCFYSNKYPISDRSISDDRLLGTWVMAGEDAEIPALTLEINKGYDRKSYMFLLSNSADLNRDVDMNAAGKIIVTKLDGANFVLNLSIDETRNLDHYLGSTGDDSDSRENFWEKWEGEFLYAKYRFLGNRIVIVPLYEEGVGLYYKGNKFFLEGHEFASKREFQKVMKENSGSLFKEKRDSFSIIFSKK